MKKWLVALVAVPALLVGCGEKEETKVPAKMEEPQMVEVEILTPATLKVNEEIELAAHVEQGGKNIDDATVEFEVWESGLRDKGQMIDGKLDADGVYKAKITFDHDGVYYMHAHTTANAIHVMPKQELTVGAPDMTKVIEEDKNANNSMMDHNSMKSDSEKQGEEEEKEKSDHNNH